MANDQYTVLKTEENGIEYFTIRETGECGMSHRSLVRACGVTNPAILKLTNSLIAKSPSKQLQHFVGVD